MPATAPRPLPAVPHVGHSSADVAAEPITEVDTSPTPRTLPRTRWPVVAVARSDEAPVHQVLPGVVQLRLLSFDEQGFGRAESVRSGEHVRAGEHFLLNEDTEGFQPARLGVGHRFEAQVTAAHYVTRVVSF